ncbi:Uncharacterized protein PBTT_08198 [Plasmodiophora brassicae]|uniref:Uncharacterized protein n=1 Tax=Plasmodiophora brassicae TaxID=37360 RepID=A0A3P3YJI3_PLABS|nr:unnamed protein product [Plasmodiophora brassicae]
MRNSTQATLFDTINRINSNSRMAKSLIRLLEDALIKIVVADKNLGLCVLTRNVYHYYEFIGNVESADWQNIRKSLKEQPNSLHTQTRQLRLLSKQADRFTINTGASLTQFHVTPS